MKSQRSGPMHLLLIERGEKIIESLLAYCSSHHISCAALSGIGAVDLAEIMHYIVDDREYSSKTFSEPMEITALIGNISLMDGKPHAHCHISLGRKDFSIVGGHLKEAIVHAVCEITLIESDLKVNRQKDDSLGLNVWGM